MARNNETTTKFKVDISELKKAMQEARKQVAYANSEFKEASSSMDEWSKSSDGINAKLKQLKSNLQSQETVLSEYEKILEEVKEEYGENSDEAMEWATKLNNQKATVNKTKKEIADYEDTLEEVVEAEKIASKTGQDVADVLEDMGKEAEDAEDGFTVLKGAVATFAGNVLTGLANGLKDAVSNLISLSDETREYRDQMNKLNSAGTEAGYGVDYVKDKYKDLYGILADETATATTISNFMAMGAEEETLNSLLESSIGIWAKYGDSIPLDGLAEAINETAKVGTVTGGLADALNWAGINEDDFNAKLEACTSEQERQKLIAETLESTYGDLSKSYQDSNKSIIEANKANADYTDVMAEMGAKIEPVTTSLKTGFTGLLQELLKLVGGVDMEAFATKVEGAFGVLKDEVLPAIKNGLGWILANKDAIIAGLAGIATGFLAFKVVTLIQGVASAMQGMTIAQYALNLAMSLNPIGILVALLAGLVVAFVTLWNNCDSFREFWVELWENIQTVCSNVITAIVNFFTVTVPEAINNMVTFLSQLPSKVWEWLLNVINKVAEWSSSMITKAGEMARNFVNKIIEFVKNLPSRVFEWLTSTLSKLVSWGSNLLTKGKEIATNLVNGIVNIIKGLPEKFITLGSNVISGLWSGISGAISGLYENIKNSLSGLVDKAKGALGINSPSKVFADEVGKWIPEGIAVGIDKNAKSALNAMKDLTADSLGSAKAGLVTGGLGSVGAGVVNNFTQVINSPKQLSRLDIYRQSKNLLGYAGGGV